MENLEHLQQLDTLNVSNNTIYKIENISAIPKLGTLQISHNRLSTADDLKHLAECHHLSVVDVSHNRLDDPDVLEVFASMKNLHVLNMMGNPVIKKIKNYRKTFIIKIKGLRYLDDRPVFPRERACAEAWEKGGVEAEREERERWITREQQKIMDSVNALSKMRETRNQENRDNASNEEKEEESSYNSEAASDDSDSEDNENTEQPQIPAEELQGSVVKSCDVKRETAVLSTEGDSVKLKSVNSAPVPDQQSGEEIETVSVEANSQLFGDHGIFGGSRAREGKRAGPMITEIVVDTGKEEQRKGEGVLITELEDDDIETISLSEASRNGSNDFPDPQEDLPELEEVDVKDPFFIRSFNSTHSKRKPLIEELDDNLESKGKPLIQEFEEEDLSIINQDHNSPSRPVIEEINERFARLNNTPNKPSRALIEELDTSTDFQGNEENSKPLITKMPPEEVRDLTVQPNANTAEPRDSGLSGETDSQSSLGPSWKTLQKLAEQVGSTIEREPLDLAKERKAFVKRMRDTNLGDLD